MTPEIIAAWAAFAVAVIGAIGAIAYKAARAEGQPPQGQQGVSYLVLDARAVQDLKEAIGTVAVAQARLARALDELAEAQERYGRGLDASNDLSMRIMAAAGDLRVAMAELTTQLRNRPPR